MSGLRDELVNALDALERETYALAGEPTNHNLNPAELEKVMAALRPMRAALIDARSRIETARDVVFGIAISRTLARSI